MGKPQPPGRRQTVWVVNPYGTAWSVKFYTVDSAWSRVAALARMPDTPASRTVLSKRGWKVEDRP